MSIYPNAGFIHIYILYISIYIHIYICIIETAQQSAMFKVEFLPLEGMNTSHLSYVSLNSWLQSILELLDVNLSHLFDNSDIESFIFIL